jgi:type II secretion system protein G
MSFSTRLRMAQNMLNGLKKRARRGFTLIELLVVVVIIGILASVALPSFIGAQDKARNAAIASNIGTVRMGLEQFGTDNNGSYPSTSGNLLSTAANTGLGTGGYLPGNRLPKAPWSSGNQSAAVAPGTNCPAASAIALGTSALASVGTVIAPGTVNATRPTGTTDYGYIAYDYALNDQTYVIYGTGKKGRQAIVGGAASNGGG